MKRQFRADAPDRLWFCDITQHRSRDGWVYCAAVIDAFSRRIVGSSISDRVTAEIVVDALEMARRGRRPEPGTVVHVDRGVQYTSWLFGHRLRQAGLLASMGRIASPVGTPRSAISASATTKPFTPPPRSRHGQHTRTVRDTGSGSTRLTGAASSYKNLREEPPDHGIGRSRGGLSTKIHQLVDGNGLPLVALITPGQAGDSPMFLPLMAHLRVGRDTGRPRTRPEAVRADKATRPARSAAICAPVESRPRSPSPTTRRVIASVAGHDAAARSDSTPPTSPTGPIDPHRLRDHHEPDRQPGGITPADT